jgi:hypothetical protein
MGKKAILDVTPEQRAALAYVQERLRKSPWQTEEDRERLRLIGESLGLRKVRAAQPEQTSRKRRKPGGGNKPMLSEKNIKRGKRTFRRMLDEDQTWAKNQEASAKHLLDKLKLGVSWYTVKRWIVAPILKERRAK